MSANRRRPSSNQPTSINPGKQKIRHERQPGMSLPHMALLVLGITNMILVPLALFAMSEVSGPLETLKLFVVGIGASGAAYAVNRFAVDRLAPLAAIGFRLAAVFAVVTILITGAGMFLGSLTGITYGSVEIKTYQANGQELTSLIDQANETALVTTRIAPSAQFLASDIDRTANCEALSSCLSKDGVGGRGPMALALESVAAKAFDIATALDVGGVDRAQLLIQLNRLSERYNEKLADSSLPIGKRRTQLQAIHGEIRQTVTVLGEALPISLVKGFAQELQTGVTIADDPGGTRLLNTYLRQHGDALTQRLDDLPDADLVAPSFPDRPGMLQVLFFLADFAAIAAIVFVGELCLPITLYVITWLNLVWEREQREFDLGVNSEPDDDGLDGLIDPPLGTPGT